MCSVLWADRRVAGQGEWVRSTFQAGRWAGLSETSLAGVVVCGFAWQCKEVGWRLGIDLLLHVEERVRERSARGVGYGKNLQLRDFRKACIEYSSLMCFYF